ncbi:MAG: universal stress protein [Acidobacteriaceae bacterium]
MSSFPPIALQEILLATDFGGPSRRALAFAKQIALRRAAPLRIVHVLDLTGPQDPAKPSFAAAHDAAKRALREIRRELRLSGIDNTATLISAGNPAAALRELVLQHRPSLLILGLNVLGFNRLGLNGPRSHPPTALGSTAQALLDAPPCPILTVSESCPEHPPESALERVLFVVDASPESLRAALDAWPLAPHPSTPAILAVLPRRAQPAWKIPEDLQRRFHPILVLDRAKAEETVLHHARESRAGLIVAAFPGGTQLGSLAHALLTQALCPILTVRA